MSYATEHPVRCTTVKEECTASYPGSKWHAIKATDQGWFTGKDGKAYCPNHLPAWVKEWRAKEKRKENA